MLEASRCLSSQSIARMSRSILKQRHVLLIIIRMREVRVVGVTYSLRPVACTRGVRLSLTAQPLEAIERVPDLGDCTHGVEMLVRAHVTYHVLLHL